MQVNSKAMTLKLLGDKLLQVILLLIGLYVLQTMLLFILSRVPDDGLRKTLMFYSTWIANILFGLVIYWLARKKRVVAIPIGILSVVLPIYGPIFYVLTTMQNKKSND